ncbi:MAG: hypothetical protein QXR17_08335 [Candidatus Bathyarchaeia archaeon]
MKNGNFRRINITRLALLVVYMMLLLYSIDAWSFNKVFANLTTDYYYSLIGTNYDTFVLLSFRPLVSITMVLTFFLVSSGLWRRSHEEKEDRGWRILSLNMTLILSLTVIIIVNYPYVIHRDAYLHGGVSEYTVINGRYDPIMLLRNDAYVSPNMFVLYSVYSIIMSVDIISLEILMTIFYPILLVVFLGVLTNGITIYVTKTNVLPVLIAIFPTLITHTLGITLFHRYYLSILIAFCILSMIRKEVVFKKSDSIILFLLFTSLQFTHPITSIFIALFIVIYYLFMTMLSHKTNGGCGNRWATLASIALIATLLHITYLWPANMVLEAFEWIFDVEKLFKFVEVSYPVRIRAPQACEGCAFLHYFSQSIRWLWRVTLMLIVMMFLIVFMTKRKRINLLLSSHWFSLLASASIIVLPTIASFLWQLRALPYFGLAAITLIKEELEEINRNKLLRTLCIVIVLLSIVITPIIHYERSYLSEMWNPPSLIHTLEAVTSLSYKGAIYGGTKTSVYFTYWSNKYRFPRMVSIYDPTLVTFRPEIFESAIGRPIVLSVIDPEYMDFNKRLTGYKSSIIYNSGLVTVYIVNS